MDVPQPVNPLTEPNSDHDAVASNPTAEVPPPSLGSVAVCGGEATATAKKRKNLKKKRKAVTPELSDPHSPSVSSSSACLSATLKRRGFRVFNHRRNPRPVIGPARHREDDIDSLALPLGMSIAAVFAQVLERKDAAAEKMSVDHLSTICTLAVRESLANAFGDQFESFVRNFEKSFRSTLMTLRLVNESSMKNVLEHQKPPKKGTSISEANLLFKDGLEDSGCETSIQNGLGHRKSASEGSSIFEMNMHGLSELNLEHSLHSFSSDHQLSNQDEVNENMLVESMNQLTLHDGEITKQLACVSSSTSYPTIDKTKHDTFEKAVIEQARSNDLKKYEIGLMIRKLQLKEKQLAVNSQANILERWKLSLGVSRASFKAEKFKSQLEDARHAELLKTCIDCLVAGLFIMVGCLGYGAYVYSHKKIAEATAACAPSTESKSWWMTKPLHSFNSGMQTLKCQTQVLTRMLFGVLLILAIAYLLIQRSATSHHTMPVTLILLFLGAGCGLAGKFCIDTLGGSGYHWLLYWEPLCLLHFFSNLFISTLYIILNGPITEKTRSGIISPYWMRKVVFYGTMLVFLPILCGLMPFAGPGEWKDHFSLLFMESVVGIDY